jgi:hypothetical protein
LATSVTLEASLAKSSSFFVSFTHSFII